MKKVLVAGGNGQLGHCLKKISDEYNDRLQLIFLDREQLDVTNQRNISDVFAEYTPDVCINATAYTAVDLAETDRERAFAVNAGAVALLAEACKEYGSVFIHVSTDYVFDGETSLPYSEDDFTNPTGVYGESKRRGEELALDINPKTIVVRTSWLYSEFNKNFVKTMLNLFKVKEELGIVADQFGQPTNANDLAEALISIVLTEPKKFGIYHYSNYPETTWFNFAEKIAELSQSKIKLKPITTPEFPTPAKRPGRSTMCLDKIQIEYNIEPKHWERSLENCMETLLKGDR